MAEFMDCLLLGAGWLIIAVLGLLVLFLALVLITDEGNDWWALLRLPFILVGMAAVGFAFKHWGAL